MTKLKEDHRGEIDRLIKDVDEEIGNKSMVDKKLNDVRKEVRERNTRGVKTDKLLLVYCENKNTKYHFIS